jgi:hypothetical protein
MKHTLTILLLTLCLTLNCFGQKETIGILNNTSYSRTEDDPTIEYNIIRSDIDGKVI